VQSFIKFYLKLWPQERLQTHIHTQRERERHASDLTICPMLRCSNGTDKYTKFNDKIRFYEVPYWQLSKFSITNLLYNWNGLSIHGSSRSSGFSCSFQWLLGLHILQVSNFYTKLTVQLNQPFENVVQMHGCILVDDIQKIYEIIFTSILNIMNLYGAMLCIAHTSIINFSQN